MHLKKIIALVIGAACAVPAPSQQAVEATGSLSSWLSCESSRAIKGVLDNIGSNGALSSGAKSGIVIASPSTSNPNYLYTWSRDSALTFKALVDQFIAGNTSLESQIQNYITAQAYLQTVQNPSGDLCFGGLGEPKFNIDETVFTGSWGRPQRDGPALRATALIAYSRYLLAKGQKSIVSAIIWPVVQNDLTYVTQYWNSTTFDLWEEVQSSSYFTTAAQYRSLVEGNALASQLGTSCPNCASQAPLILCFLQTYWNGAYILANTGGGRSGKDANTLIASIHMFDPAATCDSNTLQPCSDKALANHKAVTDSFRSIYAVNNGIAQGQGVTIGRYPEDVYYNGNPWYLSNFAAAEQLYNAVYQWKKIGSISITSISLAFYKDIYPSAAVGIYSSSSSSFNAIITAASNYADGYMSIAQKYTPSSGDLSEQFSQSDGTPLSAYDLTWSYAAFLTAFNARGGVVPASWGASGSQLPSSCVAGSQGGICRAATNTNWATPTATSTGPCTTPTQISVTFNEKVTTNFGDTIYIVGNLPQLGNWNTNNAVALNANGYTSNNPVWSVVIKLPTSSAFQYKYFKKQRNGSIQWESNPNRNYNVPGSCSGTSTVNDTWR